jgi:histone H3/H4
MTLNEHWLKRYNIHAEARTFKRRKARSGSLAIREIIKYQKSVETLVPKAHLERLVRELAQERKANPNFRGRSLKTPKEAMEQDDDKDMRFESDALCAIQHATEAFLVDYFRDINRLAISRGAVTLKGRVDVPLLLETRRSYLEGQGQSAALDMYNDAIAVVKEIGLKSKLKR